MTNLTKKSNLPTTDEERAEAAVFELLKILFGPYAETFRLQAATTLLRFCAPLPLRRKDLSVESTKDWLATLV